MNLYKIFFIAFLFSFLNMVHAERSSTGLVTWSPEDVAQLILRKSIEKKEIDLRFHQSQQNYLKVISTYDWHALAEVGEELDSLKSINNFLDFRYRRDRLSLGLAKSFTTGLNASLILSSVGQSVEVLPSAAIVIPPLRLYSENLSLNLEQSLWQNSLGEADRAQIAAAEASWKATQVTTEIDIEGLKIKALQTYWKAFVSCENFHESEAVKTRYLKLVEGVQRRTQYSYNNPGELALARAELENKIQSTRTTEQECLNNQADLLQILGLATTTQIIFKIQKSPKPPQIQTEIPWDHLKSLEAQRLRTQAAVALSESFDSKNHPNLSLMFKASSSGVDSQQNTAFSQMTTWNSPFYYIGLKWDYYFGSDVLDKNQQIARASREIEEEKLARKKNEIQEQLYRTERKYQSTYEQVESILAQRGFREMAVKELTKTYNQGRTDISTLIDSINKFYETNVRIAQGLSDYYIAREEYLWVRQGQGQTQYH